MPVVQRGKKVNRFRNYRILILTVMALLLPASVDAQTGGTSVVLKGAVSEIVTLSILPNSTPNNIDMNVVSSGSSLRMTLSGAAAKSSVIRVPLIVRSNSGFRISAVVESKPSVMTQLSVTDVHATGTLVSSQAVSDLVITPFDLRGLDEEVSSTTSSSPLEISRPLVMLSGPRVSLGGTLESPNNALQITLLIRLKPQTGSGWLVHLTFAATAVTTFDLVKTNRETVETQRNYRFRGGSMNRIKLKFAESWLRRVHDQSSACLFKTA